MKDKIIEIGLIIFMIWRITTLIIEPDYVVYNSISFSSGGNIRETEMNVIVNKGRYNPILYDEIAEEHNEINGIPTKLTLRLYRSEKAIKRGRRPFRTIVFEYDRSLKYVLLE